MSDLCNFYKMAVFSCVFIAKFGVFYRSKLMNKVFWSLIVYHFIEFISFIVFSVQVWYFLKSSLKFVYGVTSSVTLQ